MNNLRMIADSTRRDKGNLEEGFGIHLIVSTLLARFGLEFSNAMIRQFNPCNLECVLQIIHRKMSGFDPFGHTQL